MAYKPHLHQGEYSNPDEHPERLKQGFKWQLRAYKQQLYKTLNREPQQSSTDKSQDTRNREGKKNKERLYNE